jgi:exopolysaccharide biosynthesis polyprenyl glycosylphosphotransferase
MLRRFSVEFALFSMLLDAGLVMLALRIAVALRPMLDEWFAFVQPFASPPSMEFWVYPLFGWIWVMLLLSFGVYDGRRHFRYVEELNSLTLGSLLAVVMLAGMLYLSLRDLSRALFLSFAALAFIFIFMIHSIYRVYFRFFETSANGHRRRILILGAGPVGQRVAKDLLQYHSLGLELVGFLDDDPRKQQRSDVHGGLDIVRDFVLKEKVDDVIFALPSRVAAKISVLVAELHELPLRVWVVPDYYTLALHQSRVEELAGVPMIDLRAPALNDTQRLMKRAFDLIVTFLVMPIALPLMAIISIAIKLDTEGPILFRQVRVGENGKLFEMLKFRSMMVNAEKMHQVIEEVDEQGRIHQRKNKPDPRVTRVGRVLRKTSLDELPQLFNVLKGEMSLVGPRPEMPHLVEQYELWQRKRFAVPQGITGWWQVNGRSDKPMHEHTDEDLYYVQNYSLWLDIYILIKTVFVVLRGKGAY